MVPLHPRPKTIAPRIRLLFLSLLSCVAFLLAHPLSAQEERTVRGRVLDAAAGAPLEGATVVVVDTETPQGTFSDRSGGFQLRVPAGAVRLLATRLGFAPETLTIAPKQPTVTFRLDTAPFTIDPIAVTAERSFSAASSSAIRELDIRLRPRESSQELLRLAPGLVIAQHGGGGKPEQIFLRGFDADHGTDVAISVDGTPVNLVSHAHGQGYADLHFLLPEVVERAEVRKGPFAAQDGDFATAGAVAFRTRDRLPQGVVEVRGGSFGNARALALLPLGGDATKPGGYVAAAVHTTRGPFEHPDDYRRFNVFGKWTAPVSPDAELFASASGFGGRWNASGQVPERTVESGLIGRFGAIDPSEGGFTERYEAGVGLRSRSGGERRWEARAYAVRYRLDLFSNFTFFLNDTIRGDGIEQVDDRTLAGFHTTYGRVASYFGRTTHWSAGVGGRADFADIALYHQRERERERLGVRVDSRIRQGHLFTWAQQELPLSERVRLQLGLRGDLFRFGVHDRLEGQPSELPRGSGTAWRGIVSPKANLAVELSPSTTLFANLGSGFHSNHARDVILANRTEEVLPRAVSAELGSRHTRTWGSVAASIWALDLESELIYVGDEGVTEPSGRTRRVGVDLEGRMHLLPWLWADADVNLSRGRFLDESEGANRIPLAPTVTSTGGLTLRDLGPVGGGLRYRHIGSRAADETASVIARGSTLWELFGTWQISRLSVVLAVDNLLNATWNDAQFASTSRLPGEPADGITELHFTPGAPRSLQVGVEYRF
jgi:outer membrane receptor protein involved in Fe transport